MRSRAGHDAFVPNNLRYWEGIVSFPSIKVQSTDNTDLRIVIGTQIGNLIYYCTPSGLRRRNIRYEVITLVLSTQQPGAASLKRHRELYLDHMANSELLLQSLYNCSSNNCFPGTGMR